MLAFSNFTVKLGAKHSSDVFVETIASSRRRLLLLLLQLLIRIIADNVQSLCVIHLPSAYSPHTGCSVQDVGVADTLAWLTGYVVHRRRTT